MRAAGYYSVPVHRRREFLRAAIVGAGALAFGPAFWRSALASPAQPGTSPYGSLGIADGNGIRLPSGFSSREIARGGLPVSGTGYSWHTASDGQATFATADGGWILVSNAEVSAGSGGGSSAIRFRSDGSIASAYRILGGTDRNCAGGGTPWGKWLSCEEVERGRVWECDPTGATRARARQAMGVFKHEAVAVDPVGRRVYLTEDESDGGFYRFTPSSYPDLRSGLLEIASVGADGRVAWRQVPDPSAKRTPTRKQVAGSTVFKRGEGIWYDSGKVYIATTGDNKIHAYDTTSAVIEVIYDAATMTDPPLTGVDNVTVSRSGDLFVCEDGGNMEINLITPEPERIVAPFLQVTGSAHSTSELAGVVFDPSGGRMYFASQRGFSTGVIYEVSGPFRSSA